MLGPNLGTKSGYQIGPPNWAKIGCPNNMNLWTFWYLFGFFEMSAQYSCVQANESLPMSSFDVTLRNFADSKYRKTSRILLWEKKIATRSHADSWLEIFS